MNYICTECIDIKCTSHSPDFGCHYNKPNFHWKILKNKDTKSSVPNCAICKWIKADYIHDYTLPPDRDRDGCPINYDCMAQGGDDAYGVYNNDQCKQLFEILENK